MTKTLTTALLIVCTIFPIARAVAVAVGRVHGVVADETGGVLPGVSVVATSDRGRVLATAVTDHGGRYAFAGLPDGSVRLTFQLDGFSTAAIDVAVSPGGDAPVALQRLLLAGRSETVMVHGKTPVAALQPPPPRLPPPPPLPPPVVVPVPDHDHDSICGPAKPETASESLGTIRSRRHAEGHALYARNDELLIDGGTAEQLAVGQNVVARRTYRVAGDPQATGEHTAGLLQIVAAGEHASVGVVIYACDELMQGDRLAPFTPEPVRTAEPGGTPAYDNAARILFADAGQLVGAPRRFMVIDRGRDHGIRAGQRLTLFRRGRLGAQAPSVVGEAVVVAVRFDSATIRIERATDVIATGDWAAPQRH